MKSLLLLLLPILTPSLLLFAQAHVSMSGIPATTQTREQISVLRKQSETENLLQEVALKLQTYENKQVGQAPPDTVKRLRGMFEANHPAKKAKQSHLIARKKHE